MIARTEPRKRGDTWCRADVRVPSPSTGKDGEAVSSLRREHARWGKVGGAHGAPVQAAVWSWMRNIQWRAHPSFSPCAAFQRQILLDIIRRRLDFSGTFFATHHRRGRNLIRGHFSLLSPAPAHVRLFGRLDAKPDISCAELSARLLWPPASNVPGVDLSLLPRG